MSVPQLDVSSLFTGTPLLLLAKLLRFSLDMVGMLGLLGGDDALSAMVSVHVYGNRRWLGWYNNPGSYQMSKRLGALAKSASLCRNTSSKSFSQSFHTVGRCKGPMFRALHSGTVIKETGYLAALFMKECAAWKSEGKVVSERKRQPVGVTIADLGQALPASELHLTHTSPSDPLFASIPIAVSIGSCVLCALCGDWYAFSLILVGIIASGVSCFILGSVELVFTHPVSANGSPAGDGILTSDKNIVLLRSTESAINSITRGRFSFRFSSDGKYSLFQRLFFTQCILQLLLIPQASSFGQVMFLVSLSVSAVYNAWLSSEKIHRKILFERVLERPKLTKYTLGTRTTAVVFVLLVLNLQDPMGLLNELLPEDTKVWSQWKTTMLEKLRHPNERAFQLGGDVGDLSGFTEQEKNLLDLLYEDAQAAYDGYKDYTKDHYNTC